MGRAKITITEIPEKEPQIFKSGNVALEFKIEQSTAVLKGLEPLKECFCTVRVAPKTWKKVQEKLQPESKFLIHGEVTSLGGKLEVLAIDISLIEPKTKEKTGEDGQVVPEIKTPKPPVMPVPKGTQKVIGCSEIKILEGFTPPDSLAIQEVITYIETNGKFDQPIVLDKQNSLLDEYAQYMAAVELNIERVPITCKLRNEHTPMPPQKSQKLLSGKPQGKKPERFVPPIEAWGIMPLADIQVSESFTCTPPNPKKVKEVIEYIQANKSFDKPLFIDKSNRLLDGCKRYVAAVELYLENVPVVIDI